jgi:UDP:flavonoid glycosyltransferase YjiC (YdhE family)
VTTFLFTTLPSNDLGLLTRSLPIARELASHGHVVYFCSPAKAPSRLIAEAGFENLIPKHPLYDLMIAGASLKGFFQYITSRKYRQDYGNLFRFFSKLIPALPVKSAPPSKEIWNVDHTGAMIGMLNEGFVRANCDALMELMTDCDAEVIVDFLNPLAVMAARALQKPLVAVIQGNFHPKSDGFIWWKPTPTDVPSPVPVVNKILAGYGLPAVDKLAELCVGDLTLVVGTPETDPLPDTADVTYIGPALWQMENTKLPEWIEKLEKEKPVIWVYAGNPRYGSTGDLFDSLVALQACVVALADEDVQVVLTMGHHPLPKELLPLPANFRYEAYVPGLAMAERCDLLIHHGGYGSCQTGLYAGKPSVILPTFSERESNARRIVALGAGAMVSVESDGRKKYVNAEELRKTVRHVLGDPAFYENASRISEKMRTYGGATLAARLIEEFSEQKVKVKGNDGDAPFLTKEVWKGYIR